MGEQRPAEAASCCFQFALGKEPLHRWKTDGPVDSFSVRFPNGVEGPWDGDAPPGCLPSVTGPMDGGQPELEQSPWGREDLLEGALDGGTTTTSQSAGRNRKRPPWRSFTEAIPGEMGNARSYELQQAH